MSQVVIEDPIINSPFDQSAHHFKFDEEGITDEIAKGDQPVFRSHRQAEQEGKAPSIRH
jgi:hypothetical protein